MKTSSFFLSTLVAAAAMSASAYGADFGTDLTNSTADISLSENMAYDVNGQNQTLFAENATVSFVNDVVLNIAQNANGSVTKTFQSGTSITGKGQIWLWSANANSGYRTTWNLSGVNAEGFSGVLGVGQIADKSIASGTNQNGGAELKISGEQWTNTEIRLVKNSTNNPSILTLVEATTIAGISDSSAQFTSSGFSEDGNTKTQFGQISASAGTILTFSGSGNYTFSGNIGFAGEAIEINMTGTGTQVLRGTNYLTSVSVGENATLDLSGSTTTITEAISNAGTIDLSGSTVYLDFTPTSYNTTLNESLNGLQEGVKESYVIGGSIRAESDFTLNGFGAVVSGNNVIASGAVYNVAQGYESDYASIVRDYNTAEKINVSGTLSLGDITGNKSVNDYSYTISGKGVVSFNATPTDHSAGIKLGNAFTGTLLVSGNVNLPRDTELGGTEKVILKDAYLWTSENKELFQNFEIQGTYTVGQDVAKFGGNQWRGKADTCKITFNGAVVLAPGASLGIEQGTWKFNGGITGEANSTLYIGRDGATVVFTNPALSSSSFFEGSEIVISGEEGKFGRLEFGANRSVMSADSFGENLSVTVGRNGTVWFGLSNVEAVKKYEGNLSLNNGAVFNKFDGSLKLTGAVSLGDSEESETTILSTYQKGTGIEIAGMLSGQGTTFIYNNEGGKTETITISGSDNLYSGTLVLGKSNADTVANGESKLVISNDSALQNAKVNLAGGEKSHLELGATNVTLAGISGVDGSKITTTVSDSANPTLTVDGGGAFAGDIAPGGAKLLLVKTGAETLTLSGDNKYAGGTTISAGTLVAGSDSALGKNSVKISGGKLEVSSDVTVSNAIEIVLNSAYTTEAAVQGAGTLTSAITVSGDLDALITLQRTVAQQYEYKLLSNSLTTDGVTVTLSEELEKAILEEGWTYTLTADNGSTLTLTIPEPSAFGLLAGVGALALVASRRRRK
ncbi:MAG: hypothetical protein E7037_04195 [Verrucomicrobia bacterium]|nr:hypothetical protein [Verrucomicrobiota bacterium]